MNILPPIHFPSWIEAHLHLLQPPVNNCLVQRGDFVIMAVGGPNARSDYHINPTEEWFYQYRGDMLLKIVDTEKNAFQEIPIKEGEMFLLPANVPHNPVRFADTIGIVIERQRPEGKLDTLRWYCRNWTCQSIVYEEQFVCVDLGTQLKTIIENYSHSEKLRTCPHCGHLNPPK